MTTSPTHLQVEHLVEALGIGEAEPRLSWRLPDGTSRQLAYQVEAGDWSSGRVDSDCQLLVPYAGPPLRSRQRVSWRVKVWTDRGESEWSEPSWFETGLLADGDWVARWIEPAEQSEPDQLARPAQLLAHDFDVADDVVSARLYATAHGVYEAFLDGVRIGDVELTPGFTYYWEREQVQTYDVTELLRAGSHRLTILVSDGWYRGQNGGLRMANVYGDRLAVLGQLHVTLRDGSELVMGTDSSWRSRRSAVVGADLMEGQTTDLSADDPSWFRAGSPWDGWDPVQVADHGVDRLCASPAPPLRRVEEIAPVSVVLHEDGVHVVDLGQNINGWVRLSDLGPEGTTITLRHGETLDARGRLSMEHLVLEFDSDEIRAMGVDFRHETPHARRPLQVDQVVSSGRADVFEPRHTVHGFRYVEIDGHPGPLTSGDVTGVFVHTDLRRTGWFECSDDRLNQLHDIALRSLRGNVCDVPTDCPQRERSAWTGDWQVFLPTAAFLYDVAGFSTKWLRDLAASQRPSGLVEHHAPALTAPVPDGAPDDVDFLMAPGCAGWGDAAVIVPWEVYRAYGDARLLEEQWPSMKAWVDYAVRRAASYRHHTREAARPVPAPHERYVWDSGFQWGEWLEPGEIDQAEVLLGDKGDVATAYLQHSSSLLAKTAQVLGRDADAKHYQDLADHVLEAWRTEFIAPDGSLTPDTQANHVRALAFGLVPEDLVAQTTRRLVQLIRDADTHLGTGFLATPYLLPELARQGHLDLAYELLLQRTPPSWLGMLERGATTVWEFWDGVGEDGTVTGSLNHYSKGAVISFLHRHVGGIRMSEADSAAAYRTFVIQPEPGGGLTSARADLDCPYGRITSSWRIDDGTFDLTVIVPPGTTATIVLPDGETHEAGAGEHVFSRPHVQLRATEAPSSSAVP